MFGANVVLVIMMMYDMFEIIGNKYPWMAVCYGKSTSTVETIIVAVAKFVGPIIDGVQNFVIGDLLGYILNLGLVLFKKFIKFFC